MAEETEKKGWRRYLSLKHYSLIRQLIIVFSTLAIIFIVVIMPLLDYNVKSIIADQMYDTLEESQTNLSYYEKFPDESKQTKRIAHIFYVSNVKSPKSHLANYLGFRDNSLPSLLYTYVYGKDLQTVIKDKNHKTIESKGMYDGKTYYYRITYYKDSTFQSDYLISLISDDYSTDLLSAISNRVIYIQYVFLVLTAVGLIIWGFSLIRPLNRMKRYVDAIKNREDRVDLKMDRDDEIGIVGDAIVAMDHEVTKQEKAKEEMIHNISHDLKTPIALIKNYTEAMKDDIYPYGDKESTLNVILENADRLEHKVKSLLYLNRLDYVESEEISYDDFDMKELIQHTIMQMRSLNDFNIEMDLEDGVRFVGNPDHWRVVVENIVDNASRYAKSVIRITLRQDTMIIYNDGEPIEEDKVEDLFDPYVKGVKGQFGLGLSIVAKTCSMYGYKVTAKNENPGVAFIFTKE
jgi:two-component system sensor histidine kinase CssS